MGQRGVGLREVPRQPVGRARPLQPTQRDHYLTLEPGVGAFPKRGQSPGDGRVARAGVEAMLRENGIGKVGDGPDRLHPNGRLWIGTFSGGLSVYDPASESFVRYRHDPGDPDSLAHDRVEGIAEDRLGRIWIATYEGLDRFDPRTGRMHQLRSHLAGIGLGILGDRFYPDLLDEAPDDPDRPLQLLARELRFVDPLSGRPREFTTGLRLREAPRA